MLQSFPLMLQEKKATRQDLIFLANYFIIRTLLLFFVKMYKSRIQKRE